MHIPIMASERLKQLVEKKLAALKREKKGGARERLAATAGVSGSTIQNALKGRRLDPETVYRLALACDAPDKEARDLAGRASAEAMTA